MSELQKIFKMSVKEFNLLDKNNWHLSLSDDRPSIVNSETGCYLSGDSALFFAKEKVQELLECEPEPQLKLSKEEIFSLMGYTIVCESPFEIEYDGLIVATGECAKWLEQEIITNYKKIL